jgi:hypothetical protein
MSEWKPSTKNYAKCRVDATLYKVDADIYTYGAMKNHLTMNLKRFMIRAVFALYPGLSRRGIWTITNCITNDSKNERGSNSSTR